LGSDDYEQLVGLRAFDGLRTDDILTIGLDQLEFNKQRRREVAAKIDPNATEEEVLDRIKSDQPASFSEALDGYRKAMGEARSFVIDHGIASMPAAERLRIVETPEYLRRVMPFAAYFPAAKFEPIRDGIYIVTPSVDGEATAMREHNWGSIYNTSIHEAYPGHHQQMSAALDNPSTVRLLVDAPEFVEGWAMYCEQMMREEGFDTAPERLFVMYTARSALKKRSASWLSTPASSGPTPRRKCSVTPRRPPIRFPTCWARSCCCACVPTSSAAWATSSRCANSMTPCWRAATFRSASIGERCWHRATASRRPDAADSQHRPARRQVPPGVLAGRLHRHGQPN
jgi:hypothetical protein